MIKRKGAHPLGQVFLNSKSYRDKIISFLPSNNELLIEIGPGHGVMTQGLREKTKRLIAIEYDRRLVAELEPLYKDTNVEIINSDILKFSLKDYQNLNVFGNIPYHISSPIMTYLVENRSHIRSAYLTVQKEFAQKLLAKPGDDAYGFLSVFIQFYAKVQRHFNIPAGAFSPVPKVDSSFIQVDFYPKPRYIVDESLFWVMVRRGFNFGRKRAANALGVAPQVLTEVGIDLDLRPQDLTLEQFVAIFLAGRG